MRRAAAPGRHERTAAHAPRLATVAARAPGARAGRGSPRDPRDERGARRAAARIRGGRLRPGTNDSPGAGAGRTRVLVADRHEATRAGLHLALTEDGFQVCATCADATEALAAAAAERPDICLIGVDLPGGGAAAAAAIALHADPPRIVMLAASDDPAVFFAALRAGVHGYVRNDCGRGMLAQCVRAVAAGEAYVGPSFLTRLVDEFRASGRRTAGELSRREREVLGLLAQGLTTKQVAARLERSPITVRRHVSSALRKLGYSDRKSALALLGVQAEGERK